MARKLKVEIVEECRLEREPAYPGDVIELEERTAHQVVGAGKARWPEGNPKVSRSRPRPTLGAAPAPAEKEKAPAE